MTLSAPVVLPRQFVLNVSKHGSVVQQILIADRECGTLPLQKYQQRQVSGRQITLPDSKMVVVFDRKRAIPDTISEALQTSTGEFPKSLEACKTLKAKWIKPTASQDLLITAEV